MLRAAQLEGSRHRGDVGVAPDSAPSTADDDVEELSLPGDQRQAAQKPPPPLTKFSKSGRLFVVEKESEAAGEASVMDSQQIDRCLDGFWPAARLLIVIVPYYTIAVIFYIVNETKECESDHALNAIDHDASNDGEPCMEPWTAIDALYFTTVSMSTVGYGDLTPSSTGSRIFTMVWILVGISFVFIQFAIVFQHLFDWIGNVINRLVQIIYSTPPEDPAEQEAKLWKNTYLWFVRELLLYLFIFFCLQLIVGIIILWTEPNFVFFDTVWYCFVTATTVGYGDINVKTQPGRLFATFHLGLSVVWLAAILGHVQKLIVRREAMLAHERMMKRRLDYDLIRQMDRNGDGVDRIEFIIGTLIHLGVQIGGETLSWAHINPLLEQFEAFDVDGDERLTAKDLRQFSNYRMECSCSTAFKTSTAPLSPNSKRQPPGATVPAFSGPAPADLTSKRAARSWSDGTVYEGEWLEGRATGVGVTRWTDGSKYDGAHVDGRPHGLGTCTYTDGATYDGAWANGERDGVGVLRRPDGSSWSGQWRAGKRHGHGALVSAGGDRDEGEWSHGERKLWASPKPAQYSERAHEKQPPVKTVRILTSTGMTSNARVAPSG